MKQPSELAKPIGYYYRARELCPWCFENQGRVAHEGVILPDDLVGLLTRCSICGTSLSEFADSAEIEKLLQRLR
jgi:hypothetical protein